MTWTYEDQRKHKEALRKHKHRSVSEMAARDKEFLRFCQMAQDGLPMEATDDELFIKGYQRGIELKAANEAYAAKKAAGKTSPWDDDIDVGDWIYD